MPRPSLAAALALAVPLAPLVIGAACGASEEPRRPTVLLVVLDALHARHVSHLGYPRATTPYLDALAADGITYASAFAPAPFTLASIPSLLTGRRPDRHGVFASTRRLAEDEVTLAEHLGAHGYRTFGAVTNLNGSSVYGADQGFDAYTELFRAADGDVRVPRADELVPVLERWCDEAGAGGEPPFFYLHVFEPHEPYAPPREYRERFLDPAYDGRFRDGVTAELTAEMIERHGEVVYAGPDDLAAVMALYDGNLAYVDAVLGRLLDVLRARGMYEDALVIVTSDHGEAFWQHGRRGHGGYLYDEELHVPLVVKLPGPDRPRGVRTDRLASLLDVVPGLCAWLDLPLPASELDGSPLGELARADGAGRDDRKLILGSYRPKYLAAIRTPRSKTIVKYDPDTRELLATEHYRLTENPDEDPRRSAPDDPLADVFAAELERVIERAWSTAAGGTVELSDADRAALEALGYTDAGAED
jgi:arylsulfatase A-like enzyme